MSLPTKPGFYRDEENSVYRLIEDGVWKFGYETVSHKAMEFITNGYPLVRMEDAAPEPEPEPGYWQATLDGPTQGASVVVFERSEATGRIYVDAARDKDRSHYVGFYLTPEQLQEIVKAMEA